MTRKARRGRRKALLLVAPILILGILGPSGLMGFSVEKCLGEDEGTKAWNHEDFEDNIQLTYSPKNPNSTQSVNVVIESKEGILIKGANIHLNVTRNEGNPAQGGWSLVPLNDTVMETTIPAYEVGDIVSFHVEAWDYDNEVIVSQTYSYVVGGEAVEGWRFETFDENVAISYAPAEPDSNQRVRVSIMSKDAGVAINGANLHIKVKFRGQGEQTGGLVFTRVNSTTMVSEIPGYPVGTTVTFWVEAWDKDIVVLTSDEHSYAVTTFGYEAYGNEPFPTNEVYGAYAVSLLASALILVYSARVMRRTRKENMKAIEGRTGEGSDG
jgi:hypothetical protein